MTSVFILCSLHQLAGTLFSYFYVCSFGYLSPSILFIGSVFCPFYKSIIINIDSSQIKFESFHIIEIKTHTYP